MNNKKCETVLGKYIELGSGHLSFKMFKLT